MAVPKLRLIFKNEKQVKSSDIMQATFLFNKYKNYISCPKTVLFCPNT